MVMDADGSDIAPLLTSGYNGGADWSPSGNTIVFHSGSQLLSPFNIYTMNADGSNMTQLTFEDWRINWNPNWSPDGSQIVFSSDRAGSASGERVNIFVMNADGSGITQLTFGEVHDHRPAWSPDGTKIAFQRRASLSSPNHIFLMSSDGSNIVQLTDSDEPAGEREANPTWSPDSRKIAFSARVDGEHSDIYVLDVATIDETPPDTEITSGPGEWIDIDYADLEYTGSDDRTATKDLLYAYRLDGAPWSSYEPDTTATLSGLSDGPHAFYVKAKDEAGNEDPIPAEWTFGVDLTPPTTTILLDPDVPDGDNGWYVSSVTVNLEADDDLSGVALTEYSLDNGTTWHPYVAPFAITAEGTTSVLARSTDAAGNEESPPVTAAVRIDRTPPVLAVVVCDPVLWPPNHMHVTVEPYVFASDNLTSQPSLQLTSVTSSEPDEGLGDGDMPSDIVINEDGSISLRAERSGTGSGRVYTITYVASDEAGNTATETTTVIVPHDQGTEG
jgi:hypothetical protein